MEMRNSYFGQFARLAKMVHLHPWLLYCDFACVILEIGSGGIERHAAGYVTDLKITQPQKIFKNSIRNYSNFLSMFPKKPGLSRAQREWADRLGRCRVTLDCLTLPRMLEGIIIINSTLIKNYGIELDLLSKKANNQRPSQLFLRCESLRMQIDDWLYDYLINDPKTRDLRFLEPKSPELFRQLFEDQLEIFSYLPHYPPIEF